MRPRKVWGLAGCCVASTLGVAVAFGAAESRGAMPATAMTQTMKKPSNGSDNDLSKGGRPRIGERPRGPSPKIHITLTESERERLRGAAKRLGVAEAEIVREALSAHLALLEENKGL